MLCSSALGFPFICSHQEHSNLFQDDGKKDQAKTPVKVLRLRAAALETLGHHRSQNHQRRIEPKNLVEDLEVDLFQEMAEVQERAQDSPEFLQEITEERAVQERTLLEKENPKYLFQEIAGVNAPHEKTLLEKEHPKYLFQGIADINAPQERALLEKGNPKFLFQVIAGVRGQERTLLEKGNLQEIAAVKGLQERTLLEKIDPKIEPVTPMCSLNPPTVSESEMEVPPFPIGFTPLSESAVKGVERFVYFIGYGRSGHSIIASMLDAHPNIIIAHEYSIFENLRTMGAASKEFLYNELYWNSYENAVCRDGQRNAGMDTNGYTLDMPGLWQGRFQQLQVVGDESARYTAMEYHHSPEKFSELHSQLLKTIGVPVLVIHVVRNPYDIIANELLDVPGMGHVTEKNAFGSNSKFFDLATLRQAVNRVLTMAEAVVSMTRTLKLSVLDFHMEDFIRDPKAGVQKLCDFLAVKCSQDYLQKCYNNALNSVSRTRDAVWWPRDLRRFIEKRSQTFSFFRRYSFQNDV